MKYLGLLLLSAGAAIFGAYYWYGQQRVNTSEMAPELSGGSSEGVTIIIPGITGDLAKRKLLPALYRLFKKGVRATVIGTGRREADVRTILQEAQKFVPVPEQEQDGWRAFCAQVSYEQLNPEVASDFDHLAAHVKNIEAISPGATHKRLVYLSLPADVFCSITKQLVRSGLVVPHEAHTILYEKPFGWSLASAQQINACISSLLPEKQIYRVDHYVAKSALQILSDLAGDNRLLAPLWQGRTITCVEALFHETIGIEGRGQFYDKFGVIRDVVQNHVLQALAFFACAPTPTASAQQQAAERAHFLSSLTPTSIQRGQYKGYRDEPGVLPESDTETYTRITLTSNDPRWHDVLFVIEAGKALATKKTQVRATYAPVGTHRSNICVIQLSPEEVITLQLNGRDDHLLEFKAQLPVAMEAYEAIVDDVISGTLRYGVSFSEIEAQWRLVDQILKVETKSVTYAKGEQPAAFSEAPKKDCC